jgi:hypothetical protein
MKKQQIWSAIKCSECCESGSAMKNSESGLLKRAANVYQSESAVRSSESGLL